MSALAEALVAAQRRALQAVEKAYVAGQLDGEAATARLTECGITDPVDLAYDEHRFADDYDVAWEPELLAEPAP